MCMVPVIIKHIDSLKEIVTHAILDSCSQGTFVVEDLVELLAIKGTETSVHNKHLLVFMTSSRRLQDMS